MSKINTKNTIKLYDDRGKGDGCFVNEIIFEDDNFILCKSEEEVILIDKENREVLTSNFEFYYAENI